MPEDRGRSKKALLSHTWDKSACSCDTTQIDVKKRPLASRTIMRARWITGGVPSASTWLPVQAALGSPFAGFVRPRSHPRGLSLHRNGRLLLFLTGLCGLLVALYYTQVLWICQLFFSKGLPQRPYDPWAAPSGASLLFGGSFRLLPQEGELGFGAYYCNENQRKAQEHQGSGLFVGPEIGRASCRERVFCWV